ncbi:hypothetical protein [Actinomycetospora soli]|uniref:hypothetical protein n=1 Tax=Actinomycetospora soli TaxID=2893887 RepID=UPI001E4F2991|nr:hypothetical protein [Actinomycetospora soli]MCD2186607.1 hypothetical protein [Actinomycetospora soli]
MTLTLERRVDTLLREIDAGRRPAADEVSAVCDEIAAIPRSTTTMPVWKRRELDEARRELQRSWPTPASSVVRASISPTPLSLEAQRMRARAARFTAGVTRGLPVPQRAIADLVTQFAERRSALDTGHRVLNDAAVRELILALVRRGYAAPE